LFPNVLFDNVVFEACSFSIPVVESGIKYDDDIYYAPTLFLNCIFIGRFLCCDASHILFDKVHFTLMHFERSELQDCAFTSCSLSSVDINDCNLRDTCIVKTDIFEISFSDERNSLVNENTYIDYRVQAKKPKNETVSITDSGWKVKHYDDMVLKKSKSLKNFSRLFETNNFSDLSGEYFYRAKLIERKTLHRGRKTTSTAELVLCGYGERPLFTMLVILLSIFIFALIYMFIGINASDYPIHYSLFGNGFNIITALSDYGKCLFFSVTTFSTVGYGNYLPYGSLSMVVSGIQMIVGVSLCALWTGCIFRKIAR